MNTFTFAITLLLSLANVNNDTALYKHKAQAESYVDIQAPTNVTVTNQPVMILSNFSFNCDLYYNDYDSDNDTYFYAIKNSSFSMDITPYYYDGSNYQYLGLTNNTYSISWTSTRTNDVQSILDNWSNLEFQIVLRYYQSNYLSVGVLSHDSATTYATINIPLKFNCQFVNNATISNFDVSYMKDQVESFIRSSGEYSNGYNDGYSNGYQQGNEDGYSSGRQDGWTEGYNYADNQNATAVTIFSGIVTVGLLPINFFLAMLNFEVFGINIGGFVSSLLTIAIVVIVIRIVIGSGNGDKK